MKGKFYSHEIEAMIKILSKNHYSYKMIIEALKREGHKVSKCGISRVLNSIGRRRVAAMNAEKFGVFRERKVRTRNTIKAVEKLVNCENPSTYRVIQKKMPCSLRTINRIIHEDLALKTRRKKKVHRLKPQDKKIRKRSCRILYERYLAGDKSEFIVTLDEAWFYLSDSNKKRKNCYVKRGDRIPEDWINDCKEAFPSGFMVVGILSGRGAMPLIKIPKETKINSTVYQAKVLSPIFDNFIPNFYPGEAEKVHLHHDRATSHTSRSTRSFIEEKQREMGINVIETKNIPVRSPDVAPLDFYCFGMLKQRLFKRRPTTLDGLWNVLKDEWSKITVPDVKKCFASWKKRCRLVVKNQGNHIEQLL